ncbi:hypothetical protein [Telmatospirillum sp.]|uniref:hypothetical protein n=1 Tax=Telmatospirillum sp. TaxID=2079197 RepID=UPI00283CE1D8|nr:hypothetical protein [Telmatospirillum sp.]MDR3438817.1 hypothetical protein [Telmatospirillum sp.]
MKKQYFLALFGAIAFYCPVAVADIAKEPPGGDYVPIPKTLMLPDFPPKMGTLYVDRKTVPVGPYLAYDHSGKLVATLYMLSMKDMDAHKKYEDLPTSGAPVDHVDLFFNAGHPDMEIPHYHFVLWHIPRAEQLDLERTAGMR